MRKRELHSTDNKRLLDRKDLCGYTSMGISKAVEFARAVGAEKRIGRRCLYDVRILDKAIDQLKQA